MTRAKLHPLAVLLLAACAGEAPSGPDAGAADAAHFDALGGPADGAQGADVAPDLEPDALADAASDGDAGDGQASDIACPAGRVPVGSLCLCPVGITDCRGACVDTYRSALHCGGCNRSCRADEVCAEGVCSSTDAGATDAGATDAGATDTGATDAGATDAGATDAAIDAAVCASMTPGNCCGVSCPYVASASRTCVMGRCGFACVGGLNDCDREAANGCESNPATDPMNCGACGNQCADGMPCYDGRCVASCPVGQTVCNSECVNTTSNRLHCGACGRTCSSTQVCAASTCVAPCVAPRSFCGATCTDLRVDPDNCGACGRVCDSAHFCDNAGNCASCGAAREGQMIVRCGNTCVDLLADDRNCGACGVVCGSRRLCLFGMCR